MEHDIESGISYIPCHHFTLYKDYGANLTVTDSIYDEILCLPIHYDLKDEDVETVAMVAAGKWFEQYPIYGQIISLGYPESLSEVFPYLAEVLKALGAEEYVELSEENVTKIQNYFMGLIPEMVMNPLDSEEDFADFLYQCHFENGLVFDKEAFNEKLDEIVKDEDLAKYIL